MGSYSFAANPSPDNDNCKNTSSSHFTRTVCLHDWWLVKAQEGFNGKTLAVQGLTSKGKQAIRVFSSAPIVKRYDVFTLQTADEVCIIIKGFINKKRTSENGFSSEVFNHFLFGFPPNWDECEERYFVAEVNSEVDSRGRKNLSSTLNFLSSLKQEASPKYKASIGEEIQDSSGGMLVKRNLRLDGKSFLAEPSGFPSIRYSSKIVSEDNMKCSRSSAVDETIVNPSAFNQPVSAGTSDMNFTERPESSKFKLKENESGGLLESGSANLSAASLPQGPEIAIRCVDKKLHSPNRSNMYTFCVDRMQGEFLPTAPIDDNPMILKSDTSIDDTTKSPIVRSANDLSVISQSTVDVNTVNATLTNMKSINQDPKDNQKEDIASRFHMKNTACDGNSRSEVIGNADEEKLCQHISVKNSKSRGRGVSVSISSQSKDNGVSTSRPRNAGSKQKTTQRALNFNCDSVGSNHAKDFGANVACESGGKHISTVQNTELQLPADTLVGREPNDIFQDNCKFSSVGTDMKHKKSQRTDRPHLNSGIKSTRKSDRSATRLIDANHASNSKSRGRKRDNNTKESGSSEQRMKESSVSPEVIRKSCNESPEISNYKRSRSGRLLMPAMEFWRNQIAVYDAERRVTGIQEGLGTVQSSRGSKSEPTKKRRRN